MKKDITRAILLSLLCLCSCSREHGWIGAGGETPAPATRGYIKLDVTGTHEADTEEDIKTIRFIVFTDIYTYPKMEVNKFYDEAALSDRAAVLQTVIEVSRADKLVVAIANEPNTATNGLTERLNGIQTPWQLEEMEMEMSWFVSDDYQSLKTGMTMPMSGAVWTKKSDVHPTKEAAEAPSGSVGLSLERAVARVDFYINTDLPEGLAVDNSKGSSYIALRLNYHKSWYVRHEEDEEDESNRNVLGRIQTPTIGDLVTSAAYENYYFATEDYTIPYKRSSSPRRYLCSFYMPERYCTETILRPQIDINLNLVGGGQKSGDHVWETITNDRGVSRVLDVIRRNNRYEVTLTLNTGTVTVDAVAEVTEWNKALPDDFPIPAQHSLTIDGSPVVFPYFGGEETVSITTDHPDGWKIDGQPLLPTEITAAGPDAAVLAGDITVVAAKRITLNADPSSGSITVRSGNLRRAVTVRQEKAILKHMSNTLPASGVIPTDGGTCTVNVSTNLLQGWGVKIYRTGVADALVTTPAVVTGTDGRTPVESATENVAVPRFTGTGTRELKFYLYSPEYPDQEIWFADGTQGQQTTLAVEPKSLTFPAQGGTQPVTVTTNNPGGWQIENQNLPAGVSVRINGNTIQVTANPKTPGSPQTSGSFVVRATGTGLTETVTITQLAGATITLDVTPQTLNFPATGVTPKTVNVYTNNPGGWQIESQNPPAGMTVTKLNNNNTIQVTATDKAPGTGQTSGSFTVRATGTNLTRTVNITQDPLADTPYFDGDGARLAPPGVLGVTAKGELTLRGSREYKGSELDHGNKEFGPLHEETVYIAYFKFGSYVGISADKSDTTFSANDVIWTPGGGTEAGIGSRTGKAAWDVIPYHNTNKWPDDRDPCPYATVNANKDKANGYHVPDSNETSNTWGGHPGLAPTTIHLANGKTVDGRWNDPGRTVFIPYADSRAGATNGGFTGYNYWASRMHDAYGSKYLRITTAANPTGFRVTTAEADIASPVRCMR